MLEARFTFPDGRRDLGAGILVAMLGIPLLFIGTYSGGAFGGKDDLLLPVHLALVTEATGRPAKMVATRGDTLSR